MSLFYRWSYAECVRQKQLVCSMYREQTMQNGPESWQVEMRARICFKEPKLISKNFTPWGSFILLFLSSYRRRVFAVAVKVLKGVCNRITGISLVRKESRCASLNCTAGRLSPALLQLQSRLCQPSPESRAVSFCLRKSSQAWPTHLFWSVNTAERPPFISSTQSFLPNDWLPG